MDAEFKKALTGLETRILHRVDDLETRIRLQVETTETKLLTAFHNWAQTYEVGRGEFPPLCASSKNGSALSKNGSTSWNAPATATTTQVDRRTDRQPPDSSL